MSLIQRIPSILLRPKETWPAIAAEPADAAAIYGRYVVILAAIPALAGFIGWTLIGVGGFGIAVKLPVATALLQMVIGYVLSLGLVYLLALIVDALAPTFGGTKNFIAALKLVAFGSTAGFVGGVFNLVPGLGWIGLLLALYSIYLYYTGLPVLMRSAPDKAGAYTAVVIVCAFVAMVVVASVVSLVVGRGPIGARMAGLGGTTAPSGGSVQIKTPDGATVTIDGSSMAAMAKRMEEAGKRMESAQKSGDGVAAGKAMGEVLGAIGGGNGNAAPIAAADLKAMLPESIGDMKRSAIEAQGTEAIGIASSSAKASYVGGDKRAELSIVDPGGLAGLATMAGWANLTLDKETDGQIEKVYKDGARTIHESYRKDGSHGEATVILANGVIVSAEGSHVEIATLKGMLQGLDLARIEAAQRVAKR